MVLKTTLPLEWRLVEVADLNGDGTADFVSHSGTTAWLAAAWLMNGTTAR